VGVLLLRLDAARLFLKENLEVAIGTGLVGAAALAVVQPVGEAHRVIPDQGCFMGGLGRKADEKAEGRVEGRVEGLWIGKIQILEEFLDLPVSSGEALEALNLDELKAMQERLHREYEQRFKRR